jgi:anaerobic selenocysteine-containing dehydrogenase
MSSDTVPVFTRQAVLETACPLDCPDSCSLSVTVDAGKVTKVDGSRTNPVTAGYICAKVRRFGERVHGDARLLYPAVRVGPKGSARFARLTWDEALQTIADRMITIRDRFGAEAILPYSYGGSNGLLTQDNTDAMLWRRFGTSRLARTVCAAPTGAANLALYGKMPSTTYDDYPHAKLIVVWGANPSTSGIHLMPYLREARKNGAALIVVDPRTTQVATWADLHLAVRPGTDLVVALAIVRHLFENGRADEAFLAAHTTGADALRERAHEWTFDRAAGIAGVAASDLERFANLYADRSPALIRCGWGLERNRNGGSAAMAILALPAVGGKFGVRGGGYTMSNSASWSITRPWVTAQEPSTRLVNMNHLGRALLEYNAPPVKMLFVYNCNPAVTVPDQNRILAGLEREDLFTVVFDQVMTDTGAYADIVLPSTTFLESYEFARAYGPMSLQLAKPVIDAVGEARPNSDVFGELCQRLDLLQPGEATGETDLLLQILDGLPGRAGEQLRSDQRAEPVCGFNPVQFVDVFPLTPDRRVHLFPAELEAKSAAGLYTFIPDPGTPQFPLALISPSSDRMISSTLGELEGRHARIHMHPADAAARGLAQNDAVQVFNDLGRVQCLLKIVPTIRPGTVALSKGLWRKSTLNRSTGTALVPDTLSDVGEGACFNDARVEVARIPVSN